MRAFPEAAEGTRTLQPATSIALSTYLHLPVVAGIIATEVGNDLLIAEPYQAPHGVGVAMILGGPRSTYLPRLCFVGG